MLSEKVLTDQDNVETRANTILLASSAKCELKIYIKIVADENMDILLTIYENLNDLPLYPCDVLYYICLLFVYIMYYYELFVFQVT